MVDSKISALTATTALAATDLFAVATDISGTPTSKKITRANIAKGIIEPTAKTGNYTVTASDETILGDASSGDITFSLSAVSDTQGKKYIFKKTDSSSNSVIIDPDGAETIDGSATYSLTTQNASIEVESDGTTWWIASNNDVAGNGNVAGPASSTDNAIARYDSTTGKIIQNSGVTIDDSNNMVIAGTVDGRDVATDGSKLDGIEALADVTDTTNVTAAGALMDSEVDADIKTLVLPANTTISTFGATLVDDAAASNARTTLDVDQAGTDNSTNVTLAGSLDYLTIVGQAITRGAIDLTTDVTGDLPVAEGGTGSSTAGAARTALGLAIGSDVQAWDAVLDATTASFLTADETKLDGIEALADVTDVTNVTAAGALMDSEVDADIKTLVLPANTTISTFGATLVDDAAATNARTTLGLVIGTDVQAHATVLDNTTASFLTADEIKLDGIEALADVTDATNVAAAGALMDSEVTNLAQVKAFDTTDYATAAQGTTADSAMQDLVDDTTPTLGGELDCGANSVGFTAQTATGDGTTTIDWGVGNKFNFTFGAFNETFTFTAPTKPGNFLLKMIQDGVGSRTATWPATVKFPGGAAPTLTTAASSIDIVSFYFDGTNYYGQAGLAFS